MSQGVLLGPDYLHSPEKREFDVEVASRLLTLLAIPAGIVAVGSMIDMHTLNPFFVQDRVGPNGQIEPFLKFQTIPPHETNGKPYQSNGTRDHRASAWSNLVRSSGLDEYLQLVEVMRGVSSMVGVRTQTQQDLDRYKTAAPNLYRDWEAGPYRSVKHGIIGRAQLFRKGVFEISPVTDIHSMELELEWYWTSSLKDDQNILMETPFILAKAGLRTAFHNYRQKQLEKRAKLLAD